MELSLQGRVAAISGAGSGLGADVARELARRGARVLVNNRRRGDIDKAARVVAEIEAAGGTALANHDDLATEAGGQALIDAALAAFGRVDVAIHSAGVLRDRSVARMTGDELDEVLDVHLRGAFHLALPAFRAMKSQAAAEPVQQGQGGGSLLFLSSAAGIFGNPGQANYAAAKMGLLGLSNVLALEGARHGIRSNVVSPYALTPATERFLTPFGLHLLPAHVTPLLVVLSAPDCALTQQVFSAGGGHFARMLVGLGAGWTARGELPPSAEDVAAHLTEIASPDALVFPGSALEEIQRLAQILRS